MKVLLLYYYPPCPSGLATQGQLLHQGLEEIGVSVHSAHYESEQEKEWYYRWFKPDAVVGVGYWGHVPELVLHPQRHGLQAVPWLVADGYMADYQEVLDGLPLILVTSRWVRSVYARDGLSGRNIEVLPVGCDTDRFIPRDRNDPKVLAVRQMLGVGPDELMILTVGGDATSKGAQEVMRALAQVGPKAPPWKYVCKVWPQARTDQQNAIDLQLAAQLGIEKNVIYATNITSRDFMPYLLAACDIYAAPSRLEGFGMIQVEANACGKPVIGIRAMGMLDTMVHGETAFLAKVDQEICVKETTIGAGPGGQAGRRIIFKSPRTVDYRACVDDIAGYLTNLMQNADLRRTMGEAGRKRAVENYHYRVVARQFARTAAEKLGIS
jgi:alpha-maltose-1-phosphate synthase